MVAEAQIPRESEHRPGHAGRVHYGTVGVLGTNETLQSLDVRGNVLDVFVA
jgi:hypothetical protein